MEKILRNSGIKTTDNIMWGSHICQFYDTQKDLLEMLLPYFKTGLKQNEFCMWVISEPLNSHKAKNELLKKVKNTVLTEQI